jgi:acetyl-CoA/propionyl-CoA carboxylase carboxyl transferase subunit
MSLVSPAPPARLAPPEPTTPEGDPRGPAVRLCALLDPGSLVPLHPADGSGVLAVRGRVRGHPVAAYATDPRTMGGAMGAEGCQHIVEAIERAVRDRTPVIGIWHSGGARLADGVESMDGVGRVFMAMTQASGRVGQVSVVLGPAAGAAAYGPALTDVIVMSESARLFITGPDVVRAVTGEAVDMESLGGARTHGERSGVAHVVAPTEAEAYQRARLLAELFARPGRFDPGLVGEERDLGALLPDRPRRAYDIRPLLRELLDRPADGPPLLEFQPRWAPNMVVGLGRLAGHTIGVVANNPLRKGGCLDSRSAEKASRFVRMCDSLGVPLLVVVDVPGYLPGVRQEWNGVIRRGAKLLYAFAEATVPRVTLVTRKSYGGAYIAMNSKALGATAVFAWPEAEVAVMSAEAAVGILHRKRLATVPEAEREALREQLVAEQTRIAGGVRRALALGVVDEVVPPRQTRCRLAEALAAAPLGRGRHGNIPL